MFVFMSLLYITEIEEWGQGEILLPAKIIIMNVMCQRIKTKVHIDRQVISKNYAKAAKMKREIAESVREVVYSQKEFIIDMVVNRATREIRNKALPKLLENLGKEL